MATALVNLTPSQDSTMVAAVSGKIIRLHQILTGVSAQLTIKSGSTALSPELRSGSNASVSEVFNSPIQTARGEALNGNQATGTGDYPVWIVYDVVD